MAYLYLVVAFLLNSAANVLIKVSSQKGLDFSSYSPVSLIGKNYLLILGLVFFASNVIFYFLALSKIPLSTAYPIMTAMSFLLVNLASFIYLREHITNMQAVGYLFVIVGITLVVSFTKSV